MRARGVVVIALLLVAAALVLKAGGSEQAEAASVLGGHPEMQVDEDWPKPLPDDWTWGQVPGIDVTQVVDPETGEVEDRIWTVSRPGAGAVGPPVRELDTEGNVLRAWGPTADDERPDTWPGSEHGIFVDHEGFVWLGDNGNGQQVYKYTQDGEFVLAIGVRGESGGSNDTERLGSPADVGGDPALDDDPVDEIFVADGYGNRRVIVFESDTGEYQRHWGAYGNEPNDLDPGPQQFGELAGPVHCTAVASDGRVYVCDRDAARIQEFERSGEYVKEYFVSDRDNPLADEGSCLRPCWPTFDVALSSDPDQSFVYSGSGNLTVSCGLFLGEAFPPCPEAVYVLDRETGENYGRLIDNGRGDGPGQFRDLHSLASGSDGSLYVSEITGQRVQRFVPVEPTGGDTGPDGSDDGTDTAAGAETSTESTTTLPATGGGLSLLAASLLAAAFVLTRTSRKGSSRRH